MRSIHPLYLFFFGLLSFAASSCRKLIDVPPPTGQPSTATVFADDADAIKAQDGVYIGIMNTPRQLLGAGSSLYCSLSADELTRSLPLANEDAFTLNALTDGNLLITNLYDYAYTAIGQTNVIEEQLPGSGVISDSVRKQLMGESAFVRACLYFYLVNLWGDVPLVLSSDYRKTALLPRTATATVYQQIVADLLQAQQLLPAGYRTHAGYANDRTIPNQAAATALLARVYLYEGNWAGAVQAAGAVIGDSRYQLESNLDNVFLSSSREAIWQLQSVGLSFTEEGQLFVPLPGLPLKPAYLLTNTLMNAFETGDQRKVHWTKSETLGSQVYSYPYKYKVNTVTATTQEYTTVLRLAECYLVRAEALARLGQVSEALADLNTIRNRAGLPPLTLTDQAAVLAAIGHERQVELFAEHGHRWLDLKRTQQVNVVLGSEKSGWQPYDALYPLPAQELQQNPSLVQNPGY
jgi:hypothetical protein